MQPSAHQAPARTWIDAVAIVLAVLVTFGRLSLADFSCWDDQHNIWQNPHFNPPTLTGIAHYWLRPAYSLYIPVTYTVWGALAAASYLDTPDPAGSHLNPWVFHCTNVLLHAVSAYLAYLILRRLIGSRLAATLGAMLFALHPVQVEAVGWAAGLKDVLFGMFSLLAIQQYVRFVEHPTKLRYAGATLALVLAMLSKPTAMVVPAIVVAIDWLLLRRPLRSIVRSVAPWVVLAVGCGVVARIVQSGYGIQAPPLWARPLVAADALAFYLWKLVWPMQFGIDYGRRPQAIIDSGAIYWTWIVPAAVATLAAIAYRRRHPVPVAAGLIFAIGLAPVLGLVPFLFQYYSTTADHYLYLAMLGPALAGAWCISRWRLATPLGWAILALLAARSAVQTGVWHDDVTLFSHALKVNPASFMARGNLGNTLLRQGDLDAAEYHLLRAVEVKSDYWEAEQNLGEVYSRRGESDRAIPHRKRALQILLAREARIRADIAPVLNALGFDLVQAGRLDEAEAYIRQALTNRPDDPLALENLKLLESRRRAATKPSATTLSMP